ncbi:MAG: serine/threonine protein kinase [Planctomycetia bacterium]|nr:serine/threonine protein kinase [Planctomycetia bacterium]
MQSLPVIPGYELFRCLGGGPLTCVFQARECETDTPCAVKLLRPEWEDDATAIKLLQREARAGLKVQHPRLVGFRYVHVTRPPYFLVMDLLGGESLRKKMQREYQLNVPTALWIARHTAEALAALHQAGFIHGDVKPDNIRLVDAGSAMLIDLGFAHRPGENASLFEQGYVLGTVDYLAPELCGAEPATEASSDLFSLGACLFEMLTGRLPYPPGSLEQTLRRHQCDPPADIRQIAGPLPAGLVHLVERLLARKPTDRPRAAAVVPQLIRLEIAAFSQRLTG